MNLLIITQKVDKNDPILGFFCRWVEEFAKHCEKLTVICLEGGEHDFGKNAGPRSELCSTTGVKVLSLGKEEGRSHILSVIPAQAGIQFFFPEKIKKLKYVWRFYKYIRAERNNYDAVFVHMNQEYVLLGALPWKTWGKKIFMWRNHLKGSFLTDIAVWLSDKVFCTSDRSYTAKFKKTELMPVGIDTEFFRRDGKIEKKKNSILFLGRISPVKRVDLFIEAINILNKKGIKFVADIVGDPLPKDIGYFENIKNKIAEYELDNIVEFAHSITNERTKEFYNKYKIYVNLTPSGSLDKTIFEAMSTESLVLVSNDSLKREIKDIFTCEEGDPQDIADKLEVLLDISDKEESIYGKELREFVVARHSLKKLAKKLRNVIKETIYG